ncbi:hypothetical protein CCAE64S_02342 [Castellaniella caeni]
MMNDLVKDIDGQTYFRINVARRCICCGSSNVRRSPAVLMPFVAKRVFGHDPVNVTAEWGLRDLRPGMAYTLCNSLQCQMCSVLFLDYRFTDDQMAALYRGYRDSNYNEQRESYEPGYMVSSGVRYQRRDPYIAELERWIAPHVPSCPAVLDWGGAAVKIPLSWARAVACMSMIFQMSRWFLVQSERIFQARRGLTTIWSSVAKF